MKLRIGNAMVYNSIECKFEPGTVCTENGIITSPDAASDSFDELVDAEGKYLIPGFVDVHTHGCCGSDFVSADEKGLMRMSEGYIKNGTTTVMPTLASVEFDEIGNAADRINTAAKSVRGSSFVGIHLEGRYLNPAKRGAHAPELLAPLDADEIETLIKRMNLPCHITAALELNGNEFADRAVSLGATLGLGHTSATYSEAMKFYEKYNISFSHLFNAMPPLNHRDSGAVCAGLTSGGYCEMICDGIHIAPEVIKMSYKCLGNTRLTLITDSMEATGCPDGDYSIAGNTCTVMNGIALTPDGKLAGSTLNMRAAIENLMTFCNIPFHEALRCATLTPAELVGISDTVGSIAPGKTADMLIVHLENTKIIIDKIIKGGRIYVN